ncbi:unnamed protein product [Staurois parvus]|uniref:Uncharacterized protein n=1 Tax=Staurois parvus TaxID=386267 RepID=A0ABN9DTW2_9NEOB|nr:unnamed protein product [Staurois parvus]
MAMVSFIDVHLLGRRGAVGEFWMEGDTGVVLIGRCIWRPGR